MDKNLQTLELDKVLALLAEQTTCDDAKEAALALRPCLLYTSDAADD